MGWHVLGIEGSRGREVGFHPGVFERNHLLTQSSVIGSSILTH